MGKIAEVPKEIRWVTSVKYDEIGTTELSVS